MPTGSIGYLNSTPMTAHTTAGINTLGASTLVAFVSSHPTWPLTGGLPVSITGLQDSAGNNWQLLAGPTTWTGHELSMLSAIYYVNGPKTSATNTVTVNLSNPPPLVIHVFAVSGSDPTQLPVASPITSPPVGGTSDTVVTATVSVPNRGLLLAWVKNESDGIATTFGDYTMDYQSSVALWAEFQNVSAGDYSGEFYYNLSYAHHLTV
jgi:hypothetical protein